MKSPSIDQMRKATKRARVTVKVLTDDLTYSVGSPRVLDQCPHTKVALISGRTPVDGPTPRVATHPEKTPLRLEGRTYYASKNCDGFKVWCDGRSPIGRYPTLAAALDAAQSLIQIINNPGRLCRPDEITSTRAHRVL